MLEAQRGPADYAGMIAACEERCVRAGTELAERLARRDPADHDRIRSICREMSFTVHRANVMLVEIQRAQAAARAQASDRAEEIEVSRRWHDVVFAAASLRRTVTHWPGVQTMLAKQAPPERRPLYPAPEVDPVRRAERATTDDLMSVLHVMFKGAAQSEVAEAHGCHDDIPMAHGDFVEHLHAAHRVVLALGHARPVRFLDVGCGGGMKVLSAARIFDAADGLEYDPAHAAAARWLMERASFLGCRIFEGDALSFDGYADYEVIYAYRPLQDAEKAAQMERRIAAAAPKGTVLLLPLAVDPPETCARIEGPLHVNGLSPEEAAELKASAELMGPAIRARAKTQVPPAWRPVLSASRDNGHDLRA